MSRTTSTRRDFSIAALAAISALAAGAESAGAAEPISAEEALKALDPWIEAVFTGDPAVIQLTASLLVIVGVFQIFVGVQVSSAAMLRGLHDTRVPAMISFVSYWLCGMPLAALLAFGMHMEARGVWWGLALGLAVACATLSPRLWKRSRV